jgi:hypothetical protein
MDACQKVATRSDGSVRARANNLTWGYCGLVPFGSASGPIE